MTLNQNSVNRIKISIGELKNFNYVWEVCLYLGETLDSLRAKSLYTWRDVQVINGCILFVSIHSLIKRNNYLLPIVVSKLYLIKRDILRSGLDN